MLSEKRKIYIIEYEKKNKDKIIARKKEYRRKNKEKIAKQKKEYRKKNFVKITKREKKYEADNKIKISIRRKVHYYKNHSFYKDKQKKKSRAIKCRFTNSKWLAKKRGINFNLTFEQFESIINKPCFYCDNLLCKNSETAFGLDRIDNLKGYAFDNIVSCCKICNMIKGCKFTQLEAVVMISAVLRFRILKKGKYVMANEVKFLIKDLIINSANDETTITDIFKKYSDFDAERNRTDVLLALRQLEAEGLGVLAVGRRGKPTRFIRGAVRVDININAAIQEKIKKIVSVMEVGKTLVLENDGNLTIDNFLVAVETNRVQVIECLKLFQKENLGLFIIGRKGGKSRFLKKEAIPEEPVLQTEENNESDITYNVINNVLFKSAYIKTGYPSIEAADAELNLHELFDMELLKSNLSEFGYFSLIKAENDK